MSKTPKNPEPLPKQSKEDRRVRSLLRKLMNVPVEEVHEKRKEYRKRKAR